MTESLALTKPDNPGLSVNSERLTAVPYILVLPTSRNVARTTTSHPITVCQLVATDPGKHIPPIAVLVR